MIRFLNDIIGTEVVLFQEQAKLSPIRKIIFSPDSGAILGFACFDPIAKKERVFVPGAIKKLNGKIMIIDGYDSLSDISDLVRVHEAEKIGAKIVKEKVITESGQLLGRVVTATVNTLGWKLDRIDVSAGLALKYIAKDIIIPAKKIIKIDKIQITVSDDFAKIRSAVAVPAIEPIAE